MAAMITLFLSVDAFTPEEVPYGFSNNAKGFMGPPKFKKAKFSIDETPIEIQIELKN